MKRMKNMCISTGSAASVSYAYTHKHTQHRQKLNFVLADSMLPKKPNCSIHTTTSADDLPRIRATMHFSNSRFNCPVQTLAECLAHKHGMKCSRDLFICARIESNSRATRTYEAQNY